MMLTSTPTRFFLATCLGLSSMHAWSQADTLEMDVTLWEADNGSAGRCETELLAHGTSPLQREPR